MVGIIFQQLDAFIHGGHLLRVILNAQSDDEKRQNEPSTHDRGDDMGRENDGKLVDELARPGSQKVLDTLGPGVFQGIST